MPGLRLKAVVLRLLGRLLCRLGHHRPGPRRLWNQDYGFTTCARCGVDLVRSLLGDWHVPRRHRVVWRPRDPAPAPEPAPVRRTVPAANRRVIDGRTGSPFDFSDFDRPPAGSPVDARPRRAATTPPAGSRDPALRSHPDRG